MKSRILNAGKSIEIFCYDYIGGWFGGITPQTVAETLKDAGKVDTINLRINSPGGDVFDGITIYNMLKRHPATVEVDIDGLCASIATIIAMSGDVVRMASNATFMVHDPTSGQWGTAEEMRKTADLLDQTKDNLIDTYIGKTGGDRTEISDLMAAETWMRASEAHQKGFVDEITDELEMAACFDLSKLYRNAPANLSAGPKPNPFRARLAANASRVKKVCG